MLIPFEIEVKIDLPFMQSRIQDLNNITKMQRVACPEADPIFCLICLYGQFWPRKTTSVMIFLSYIVS